MANIVDNVRKLNQLKFTVAEQMGLAVQKLAHHDVETRALGRVELAVTRSSPTQIFFRVTVRADAYILFHYDPSLDEFFLEQTAFGLSFRTAIILLEEIESFVRTVLATVE